LSLTPRKTVAAAAALSLSAAALIAGTATMANASIGGQIDALTASNGTKTISSTGGNLTITDAATDASWSPDGSRAVYVITSATSGDSLSTVRFNDGSDTFPVTDPVKGQSLSHPVWLSDGDILVARQPKAGAPWELDTTSSSYGWGFIKISPNDTNSYTRPDVSQDGALVAEETVGTAHSVVYMAPGATTFTTIATNAIDPSISADGKSIAYVQNDGGTNQIFITDPAMSFTLEKTTDAAIHDNPTFSPDGLTLAMNVSDSGAVATVPLGDGLVADPPTTVSGLNGLPAYLAAPEEDGPFDNVNTRLAGNSRYDTAVKISQYEWATAGTSDTRPQAKAVVLTRGDTYADALAGSALAAAKQGPLLMTPPTSFNSEAKAEIQRVLGSNTSATVYILGADDAVSASTENTIKAMGYKIVRLAGDSRYGTAIKIANAISTHPDMILAATGANFPDALSAGAAAGSYDLPGTGLTAVVILTNNNSLPSEVKTYMNNWAATTGKTDANAAVFGVGGWGTTAMKAYHPISLAGDSRYETALFVAETFFGSEAGAGVTTGTGWPDALSGGAMLGTRNEPLLLTSPTSSDVTDDTAFLLDVNSGSINTLYEFGNNIPAGQQGELDDLFSGPGGTEENATHPAAISAKVGVPGAVKSSHRTVAQMRAAAKGLTASH
jgi:hypothetical protein